MRFAPLLIILAALGLAFAMGWHKYLSLDTLRDQRESLQAFVAANLVLAILLYAGAYVLVVATSLPGAGFMTLAGGFMFGVWLGGPVTIIAATIGACLVFLAVRYAFADTMREKAGPFIRKLQDGFEKNAFNYLLSLRLIPAVPFFGVNIASAFLNVKLRDFFFATLIGIVPGTLVYSSIGAGLGAVFDAGGEPNLSLVARPEILLPLIGLGLLSLLPVFAKALKRNKDATS
jgi:uncharacterized membrane protein YdjX (TVP38/TMEM64 family)